MASGNKSMPSVPKVNGMDYSVMTSSVKSAPNAANNNKKSANKIMYSCTK